MPRPVIGVTTSYEDNTQKLSHTYVRALEAAGGLPVIVPVLQEQDAVHQFTQMLDGLLIVGGPAIEDGLIGTLPTDLEPTDAARRRSDALLFDAMRERPVFGICYGMQFINARSGGTIYADVQAQQPGSLPHSAGRGATLHPVRLAADSWISQVFNRDHLTVNTYHIQAVAEVGRGLKPVAFGPDGVIEAIESEDRRLLGVQFHPERMLDEMLPLFRDFVDRCRT